MCNPNAKQAFCTLCCQLKEFGTNIQVGTIDPKSNEKMKKCFAHMNPKQKMPHPALKNA